jgi:imidazole glycerol phosphate synthase glutamine amidotransferase subunit
MTTPLDVDVLDYGAGNLHSIVSALAQVGGTVRVVERADQARSGHLVLPGVGAFGASLAELQARGLEGVVRHHLDAGRPFLGVCVGFQLLFEQGTELGVHTGLGYFRGSVDRFQTHLHVPHVGWNEVRVQRPHPVSVGLPLPAHLYFVHSFRPTGVLPEDVWLTSDYDGPFVAGVARDSIVATQFHPEKSGALGLDLLSRFLRWTP